MYGCIRDSEEIGKMDVGVKALGTMPLKSVKKGVGEETLQYDLEVWLSHPVTTFTQILMAS